MLLTEIFNKPIPIPPTATVMYHCTLARHMDSILSKGLIASKGQNYPELYNHPGNTDIEYRPGVWLSTTPGYSQYWIHDVAVDNEPAVILEIATASLDQSLFREDPFIPGQASGFMAPGFAYLYQGSIPKSFIKPWGEITTLDGTRYDSVGYADGGGGAGAYYGDKQVRQIQDAKDWQQLFGRIKRFFGLPDKV